MKRHLIVDNSRTFSVVLTPEPDGGFTVRVPELPEIVTYGETESEALAMARDAIKLVLEDAAARGEDIPEPATEAPRLRTVTVSIAA